VDSLRLDIDVPLRGFRLDVALALGRETLALVGPSGAGKTTILRAVAGLVRPAAGRIEVDGDVWFDSERGVHLPPHRRSVGLVFQEYALFPHLSVEKNVAFGGKARAAELLDRLRIAHLAGVRPGSLSGGERQRVGLARALGRDPRVLLLDEPLSALDAHTRTSVRTELQELLRELRLPTVIVTHDFEDAAALAGRVGVLERGRLLQLGTPAELVDDPSHPFVASLTGGNLLTGDARPGANGLTEVVLDSGALVYSADSTQGRVGLVVQPWDVTVAREASDDSALNHMAGTIASLVPLGNRVRVRIGPVTAEITAASADRLGLRAGETAVASFKATGTRLIPLG
jgi:molybdenum ABC transporter ATP-binding protein